MVMSLTLDTYDVSWNSDWLRETPTLTLVSLNLCFCYVWHVRLSNKALGHACTTHNGTFSMRQKVCMVYLLGNLRPSTDPGDDVENQRHPTTNPTRLRKNTKLWETDYTCLMLFRFTASFHLVFPLYLGAYIVLTLSSLCVLFPTSRWLLIDGLQWGIPCVRHK